MTVVEPQTFPDTIAQHETAVIDRHKRLGFGDAAAVEPDLEVFVAGIFFGGVGCYFVTHVSASHVSGISSNLSVRPVYRGVFTR